MLRYIFLLLSVSICAIKVNARIIEESRMDTCLVEVLYERIKVTDTLDCRNRYRQNYLTLRAGNNASAFYSSVRKTYDSISSRDFSVTRALFSDTKAFRKFSEEEREVIFKLKADNVINIHDRFDLMSWVYKDTLEIPHWQITDSIKEIDGLSCIKASTSFRGRNWTAWFTPEIPIPEGPWKLWGLPGLIVSAYDSKGHYRFTAKKITTCPVGYVDYFNYSDRCTTERMAALKLKRKSLQESIAQKIKESGAFGIDPSAIGDPKPLENRNYDFEETDYPHE